MTYKDFLLLLAQMRMYSCGALVLGEIRILVRKISDEMWEMRAPLLSYQDKPPFTLFRWQSRGSFLDVDQKTNHIFLVQEVASTESYLFLKSHVKDFHELALEWKEILSDTSSFANIQ